MDVTRLYFRLKALESLIWQALTKSTSILANAFVQGGNSFGATAVLGTNDANNLNIRTNSVTRATFDQAGNFVPPADNSGQVGTAALRWNLVRAVTVTTGDLVMLDDEGSAHWTLKESGEKIYARNAKTGDVFELLMKKVFHPSGVGEFAEQPHGADARALAEAQRLDEEAKAEAAAAAKEAETQAPPPEDAPPFEPVHPFREYGYRDDGHQASDDHQADDEHQAVGDEHQATSTRDELIALGWTDEDGVLTPPPHVDEDDRETSILEPEDEPEGESEGEVYVDEEEPS